MSEPSKGESEGLNRNLNWIRQHGTEKNREFMKGSGFTGKTGELTKSQKSQRKQDIARNPHKYD